MGMATKGGKEGGQQLGFFVPRPPESNEVDAVHKPDQNKVTVRELPPGQRTNLPKPRETDVKVYGRDD